MNRLRELFKQPIPISEVIANYRNARDDESRDWLRRSLIAFFLRSLVVLFGIGLVAFVASLLWSVYTSTGRYQVTQAILQSEKPFRSFKDSLATSTGPGRRYLMALVEAHQESAAERLVGQITGEASRVAALSAIARALAHTGRDSEADTTWRRAVELALKGRDANYGLSKIAIDQLHEGKDALALKTALLIQDNVKKAETLSSLAERVTRNRSEDRKLAPRLRPFWRAAARNAAAIENADTRAFYFWQLSLSEIENGDKLGADESCLSSLEAAKADKDPNAKPVAFGRVALAQTKLGSLSDAARNWKLAQSAAMAISDVFNREIALKELAELQAQAGRIDLADHTCRFISEADQRMLAEVSVAEQMATAGHIREAIARVSTPALTASKDSILREAVLIQCKAGDFAGARSTLALMAPSERANGLVGLIRAEADKGLFADALAQARTLPAGSLRSLALESLLDTEANTGSVNNLNEIQKLIETSLSEIERPLAHNPQDSSSMRRLAGIVYAQQHRYKQAIAVVQPCADWDRLIVYAFVLHEYTKEQNWRTLNAIDFSDGYDT